MPLFESWLAQVVVQLMNSQQGMSERSSSGSGFFVSSVVVQIGLELETYEQSYGLA